MSLNELINNAIYARLSESGTEQEIETAYYMQQITYQQYRILLISRGIQYE